jgi:ADP-ribose pyrophosphatase YjhB (NUDIX family)
MVLNFIGKIWKKLPRNTRRWLTRRFQAKFTVSAAAVITNERGQVLLLNHLLRPTSGWGLPGGFMNAGEQPEAALRREIREETGIELNDVKLIHIRTLRQHIEIIFAAKAVGEPIVKSREITELAWFEIDKTPAEMSRDQLSLIVNALRPDE